MSPWVLSVLLAFAVFADTTDAQIAKLCELEGGYDINTLRSRPYWEIAISNTSHCPGFIKDRDHSCAVYISFCQTLPNDSTPAGSCRSVFSMYEDASVCMVIGNQTDDPRPMGQYNKTIIPFNALKPTDGKTGFAADFPNGVPFNCTKEIITIVEFLCYPEANWTAAGTNVTQFVISAGFPPDNPCLFLISMQYEGACVTAPVTPATPVAPVGLLIEPGWILIIILICLVPIYLIGGLIVNAIRGKRTATELFPNFQFWKGFPHLLLDGVHFSLDLVTCYICTKKSRGTKYEQI